MEEKFVKLLCYRNFFCQKNHFFSSKHSLVTKFRKIFQKQNLLFYQIKRIPELEEEKKGKRGTLMSRDL